LATSIPGTIWIPSPPAADTEVNYFEAFFESSDRIVVDLIVNEIRTTSTYIKTDDPFRLTEFDGLYLKLSYSDEEILLFLSQENYALFNDKGVETGSFTPPEINLTGTDQLVLIPTYRTEGFDGTGLEIFYQHTCGLDSSELDAENQKLKVLFLNVGDFFTVLFPLE